MKKAVITIEFDQDKLDALSFFMGEEKLTVTSELEKVLRGYYEQHVPEPARRYIESKDQGKVPARDRPRKPAKPPTTLPRRADVPVPDGGGHDPL